MSKALAFIVSITKTEQEMKRLLISLLAAFALPSSVNAETYWLVLTKENNGSALENIEMKDLNQSKS